MELLLVRHGMTQGNLKKQYIGVLDQPLAPEGEALALNRRPGMPAVDKLWVSPMLRCRQTARLMFPDMEQQVCPDLRECNFGDFEGKTWEQLKDNPIYRAWIDGDYTITFPNGEGMQAFMARCCRAVEQILRQASREDVGRAGIVSHGGTMMVVLHSFARPGREIYQWMAKNCGAFLARVELEPLRLLDVREL